MIDLQTSPLANPEPVSWPSKAFRQRVIARIDDALERSVIGPRNSVQMEFLIFKKAEFKEQYLILVSKLLIRIRDTSKFKSILAIKECSHINFSLAIHTAIAKKYVGLIILCFICVSNCLLCLLRLFVLFLI